MLHADVQKALNAQVNAELYSAYLYYAMAAYFEATGLPGAAHWMKIQTQEELVHVTKYFEYLVDRGGRVQLGTVAAPPDKWKSPVAAFEAALAHEREISARIHKIADLAVKNRDHGTQNFLQWFIAEQIEEEKSAEDVVQKLRLAGNDGAGLFMIDRELAARVFTAPTAAGG